MAHALIHALFVLFIGILAVTSLRNLFFNMTFIQTLSPMKRPGVCQDFEDPINPFHFGICKN